MDTLKKNSLLIGLGGCALAILGCFLPLASALGLSITYFAGDGKILVVLAVIAGVLMYLKKGMLSLIPSGLCAVMLLMVAFKASNINLEIGYFLMVLGVICMIASPLLNRK